MILKKESCLDSKHLYNTNSKLSSPKKSLSEQKKIVKSLLEQIEIEKNILAQLEPNENPEEAEIADALVDELVCPISYAFMIDPVILTSGKTYDRHAINAEFERQKEQATGEIVKCPFTKITQIADDLIPNMQMRSITSKFVEKYKDIIHTGPSWNEIRRLCSDYLDEQKPEKIKQRHRADEQRINDKQKAEEKKRIEQQQFEEQKKRLKLISDCGLDFEEFCLLYGKFFRFYQKTPKKLYTGYAKKNQFQREYHMRMEVLRKWDQQLISNQQMSGCLSIFMEYYIKKRGKKFCEIIQPKD